MVVQWLQVNADRTSRVRFQTCLLVFCFFFSIFLSHYVLPACMTKKIDESTSLSRKGSSLFKCRVPPFEQYLLKFYRCFKVNHQGWTHKTINHKFLGTLHISSPLAARSSTLAARSFYWPCIVQQSLTVGVVKFYNVLL